MLLSIFNCRETKSKPRKYQNRLSVEVSNLIKSKRKSSDPQKKYLSNIETNTCTMPHAPYWSAGDLFPLKPFVEIPNIEFCNDPIKQDKVYESTKFMYIKINEYEEEKEKYKIFDNNYQDLLKEDDKLIRSIEPPRHNVEEHEKHLDNVINQILGPQRNENVNRQLNIERSIEPPRHNVEEHEKHLDNVLNQILGPQRNEKVNRIEYNISHQENNQENNQEEDPHRQLNIENNQENNQEEKNNNRQSNYSKNRTGLKRFISLYGNKKGIKFRK